MKHKIITNLKKKVLLVGGLPKYADRFKFFNDKDNPYLSYHIGVDTFREYGLPEGNWEYLSPFEEMDYIQDERYVFAFRESLKLEGVLFKNPYTQALKNVPISEFEENEDQILKWQEAEKNVFSQNTLIFIEQ